MTDRSSPPYGAVAGAVGVALFLASGLAFGDQPALDASGAEVAAYFDDHQTAVQVGCALVAVSAPLFVWFLATVASLARAADPGARLAGMLAFGCGLVFFALFLADVGALAVGALRPENMAADPQLAAALYDLSWMLPAMAAPLGAGLLASYAIVALRDRAIWPRWLGGLAAIAAAAHLLRVGALFGTDGPFAADGILGFWAPVAAIAGWIFVAGIVLAAGPRRRSA